MTFASMITRISRPSRRGLPHGSDGDRLLLPPCGGGVVLFALLFLGGALAMLGMVLMIFLQWCLNGLAMLVFWLFRPLLWPAAHYPDGPPALLSLKVDDLIQRLRRRNAPTPHA